MLAPPNATKRNAARAGGDVPKKTIRDAEINSATVTKSPWRDIRGKELDDRGLGKRLKPYGIRSRDVRIGTDRHKGFTIEDFHDAWRRLLPPATDTRDKGDKGDIFDNKNNFVADVAVGEEEPEPGSFEPDDPFDLGKIPAFLDRRAQA